MQGLDLMQTWRMGDGGAFYHTYTSTGARAIQFYQPRYSDYMVRSDPRITPRRGVHRCVINRF